MDLTRPLKIRKGNQTHLATDTDVGEFLSVCSVHDRIVLTNSQSQKQKWLVEAPGERRRESLTRENC